MLKVIELRCEYKNNPIGIDVKHPRISWKLQSDLRSVLQEAYHIEVSLHSQFEEVLWDSGKVQTDRSIHVELDGLKVKSRQRYYYRVRSWSTEGESSDWSEPAYWEMGLLDTEEWTAQWIAAPEELISQESEQAPMLRSAFEVKGALRQARIYATALGLYELELNGTRVGDSYFTPGWTSYQHRLQVQTYDVLELLQEGGNAIGVMLGKGWFRGNLAWQNQKDIYGSRNALLLQLHIEYEDGRSEWIVSDESWTSTGSPILMSELYHGETYDARLEMPGWSMAGFDDRQWTSVDSISHSLDILIAQENDPVRKIEEIKPIELIKTPLGETVLDFGQNMVGWVRFSVSGEAGREVAIHHAEVLDKEGNFYTENMRSAKVMIRYILKGAGRETYEPLERTPPSTPV